MKKENRKYIIRKACFEEKPEHLFNDPMIFRYKDKNCILSAGSSDNITVFRYGNDFFVMAINSNLGYAGYELIDHNDLTVISDFFTQNVNEIPDLKRDFFEYTENCQADILSQWIQ